MVALAISFGEMSCGGGSPKPTPSVEVKATIGEAVTLAPPTATPVVVVPRGQGTVVGRTPVVGYVLVCSSERVIWRVYALAVANDTLGWPPVEQC